MLATTHKHHTPAAACCHSPSSSNMHMDHSCELQRAEMPGVHNTAHQVHAGHNTGSLPKLATSATMHCLTGCAIGEIIGLAIGVTLGLNPWATMTLATLLGFAFGFALGLRPLVKQGMGVAQAFKVIWLGEVISISVMEFAMNFTDYHVGGVMAPDILSPIFWIGYGAALVAGFVAAWPVNYWMLARNIKKPCH